MDTVCHPSITQETSVNTLAGVSAARHTTRIIYNPSVVQVTECHKKKSGKLREINSSLAYSVVQKFYSNC